MSDIPASSAASSSTPDGDHVLRAITTPDNFRVMVALTTNLVKDAAAAQKATTDNAQHFAQLLTGTVLIRETMSPAHRVQAILRGGAGQGSLVADSHPDGLTRGLVQVERPRFDISEGSTLLMMREMARGVHRSMVQPPVGGTIPVALMTYLHESEQIVSMIDVATVWQGDEIQLCGGYVVQVLPDADRGMLAIMMQRLEDFPPLPDMLLKLGGSTNALLGEILYGMEYTQLDNSPVHYGCRCSEQAVVASLATLPRSDIAEIVRDEEVVEMSCDYCQRVFKIPSAQLQGLLTPS